MSTFRRLRWCLLGLSVLLAACTGRPAGSATPLESATIVHGPFEILAQGRRIGTGAFPNNSGNPFGTMEVTGFGVRYKGQPVTIAQEKGTLARFWRVVRLVDAPRPALLVSTTDFHLITEDNGQLVTRSIGMPSTSLAEYQWLDADKGQPTEPRTFGIEKVDLDAGTRLQGGRWLRLSHHSVLDIKELRVYPVQPWIDYRRGVPFGGLNTGGTRVRALSPGQTQFVTVGSGEDHDHNGERYNALLVVDIPTGKAYGLLLDRTRHRYMESDDVTPAWVDHYFRWTRDAQGVERLVPRTDARPLPWLGKFTTFTGGSVEFRMKPVKPGMGPIVVRFIQDRLGGRPAPDWLDPRNDRGVTFTVPGCSHVIAISLREAELGVFSPASKTGTHRDCSDVIRRLGELFNAELARGAWQTAFVGD